MSGAGKPSESSEIFLCYSHKDEKLLKKLETHLSLLRRDKVISIWHDRRIGAGTEWAGAIDEHLNSARIILLLVSADFLASDYCHDVEMERASSVMRPGRPVSSRSSSARSIGRGRNLASFRVSPRMPNR